MTGGLIVADWTNKLNFTAITIVDTLDDDVFARDLVADYILSGGLEQ